MIANSNNVYLNHHIHHIHLHDPSIIYHWLTAGVDMEFV